MKTLIGKRIASLIATLAMALVPLAMPVAVSAQAGDIQGSLACGSTLKTEGAGCATDLTTGTGKVQTLVTSIINIFSLIVGIVSVLMIIFGGFKYITSGGDSGNVSGAKNTILYAVVGLIIVAFAQFIVQFVLGKVTGGTAA